MPVKNSTCAMLIGTIESESRDVIFEGFGAISVPVLHDADCETAPSFSSPSRCSTDLCINSCHKNLVSPTV